MIEELVGWFLLLVAAVAPLLPADSGARRNDGRGCDNPDYPQ